MEKFKKKRIMIIGAGFLQAFVIRRARELGYYVISVDRDGAAQGFKYTHEHRTIDIVDMEGCFNYARECNIDGVLTAATDYGVLTTSYIAERLKLKGLNYSAAESVKNKYTVREILSRLGVSEPSQFFQAETLEDLEGLKGIIQYPVIVKPCDGSGSKGIGRADNRWELEQAFRKAIRASLSSNVLIENFIYGEEYGAEAFVYEDETYILGIFKKKMTEAPYYAELGHIIPSGLSKSLEDKVKDQIKKTIEALNINFGSVNLDLLITSHNKIVIVDIGARMGGNLIGSHIIPYAMGVDYIGNMIKAALGEKAEFTTGESKPIATAILALTPGKVRSLSKAHEYINENTHCKVLLNIKRGSIIETYKNNLDGCGYVVAWGSTGEEAEELAYKEKDRLNALIERE